MRIARIRPTLVAALGLAAGMYACGSDAVHVQDFGSPPDAGFDPGKPGPGDGYGSGGNTGNRDGGFEAGPPVCTDDLKRCAEDFTLAFNNETSVELRGDYRQGAWAMGDPMVKSGNTWKVSVPVPYGKPVQYKFFVNGMTWIADPANTKT